jgi:hypothetical protein
LYPTWFQHSTRVFQFRKIWAYLTLIFKRYFSIPKILDLNGFSILIFQFQKTHNSTLPFLNTQKAFSPFQHRFEDDLVLGIIERANNLRIVFNFSSFDFERVSRVFDFTYRERESSGTADARHDLFGVLFSSLLLMFLGIFVWNKKF